MRSLTYRSGRYMPPREGSDAERIRALEQYVCALSAELETLFATFDRLLVGAPTTARLPLPPPGEERV